MNKNNLLKHLPLLLVILLSCKNNSIYDNYNLIVSSEKNRFSCILKSDIFPYKGNDLTKLQDCLRNIFTKAEECIKNGGMTEKCYSIFADKILFEYSENNTISDLLILKPVLHYYDGNPGFDLKINDKILHIFAMTNFRGDCIPLESNMGNVSNGNNFKSRTYITCDESSIIIECGDRTLFKGNYNELIEKSSKEKINIMNTGYKSAEFPRFPDIVVNATCTLHLKRLYQISNCFSDCDQLLFQIGNHFNCSDTISISN